MTPAQQQQIAAAMHRALRLRVGYEFNIPTIRERLVAEGYPAAAVDQALANLERDDKNGA